MNLQGHAAAPGQLYRRTRKVQSQLTRFSPKTCWNHHVMTTLQRSLISDHLHLAPFTTRAQDARLPCRAEERSNPCCRKLPKLHQRCRHPVLPGVPSRELIKPCVPSSLHRLTPDLDALPSHLLLSAALAGLGRWSRGYLVEDASTE